MNLYLKLAHNFLCRRNSNKLSFSTVISILGLSFGVCAFLVIMTILHSFQTEMKKVISSINPHLLIFSQYGIDDIDDLQKHLHLLLGAQSKIQSKFIYYESILSSKTNIAATYINAIEGSNSALAKQLEKKIYPQTALTTINYPNKSIIIGIGLANKLKVKIGDFVSLLLIDNNKKLEYIKYIVTGIITIGIAQYDESYSLINFSDAQKMLHTAKNWASGIQVNLTQPEEALNIAKKLTDTIAYNIMPWQNIDKQLLQKIEQDIKAIKLIISIISFVACFNIIVTLTLTVLDKAKQLAILRSLGLSSKKVLIIFIYASLLISIIGFGIGLGISFMLLKIFSGLHTGNLNNFYYLDKIPVYINYNLIIISFFITISLTTLSALYPAWKATKISPILGLKQ